MENRLIIREVSKDVFLFSFKEKDDCDRVLETEPWIFDRAILVLKVYDPSKMVDFEDFRLTKFWVQIHGLPPNGMFPEVGELVGDIMGKCVKVDKDEDGKCVGKFMRVRVSSDITKPLRRVAKVRLGDHGPILWADLRYEKLPDFCFGCGRLGHSVKECTTEGVDKIARLEDLGSVNGSR